MPIEIPSTTAIKLPTDDISKQFDNQPSQNDIQFFDHQILSYNSEQFQKHGNDLSTKIINSIANLDLHLKNTQENMLRKSNIVNMNDTPPSSPKNLYYSNENTQNGVTELKRITNVSRKFQTSMLTIKFVESFISAFHTTLNRFLKM